MVRGTLEVLLVEAKGLENTDLLKNMDPYAIIVCRTQEQRSSVASGKGSNPDWNESFVFSVSDSVTELTIKLMDSDISTADDFVGEATIPLEAVFLEGNVPPTVYNVVKNQEYSGEIKIGLTFTPEELRSFHHFGKSKVTTAHTFELIIGSRNRPAVTLLAIGAVTCIKQRCGVHLSTIIVK